jgi:restriction system protein
LAFAACKMAPSFLQSNNPLLAGLNAFVALLPSLAPFATIPFLLTAAISAVGARRRRRLLDRQSNIEGIRDLTWQDFELLVGEAYRRKGYEVVENGGGGADGGIDLRLSREGQRLIVQCKRWKTRQIGVSAIRELYGLMTAEKATGSIFVSSGTYTSEAQRFATDNGVVLVDGSGLLDLIRTVQVDHTPPLVAPVAIEAPNCPACGNSMIMRTARRGKNIGMSFWGCTSYPKCKGTIDADQGEYAAQG